MPSLKLTKTAVETARPEARDYELRDTTLLDSSVRSRPPGASFMLSYRTPTGERLKPRLGVFGVLTVDQARKLAQEKGAKRPEPNNALAQNRRLRQIEIGGRVKKNQIDKGVGDSESLKAPSPWPGANARLLGLGQGLPVAPLDRLANFSAAEFERFTLEWASDYLAVKVPGIVEVQQRGGAGDKGRDVIDWLDPNTTPVRRWSLSQCKHYSSALGAGTAAAEIGKVLYYSHREDYRFPGGIPFRYSQGRYFALSRPVGRS